MITGGQMRAARGFLKWSAKDLAQKSGVGWATIQCMEGQEGIPNVLVQNVEKAQAALEAAGIEFLPDNAVKLKK
jgi:ribosome-binding protein aMBF1 (putative translation factor)